MVPYNDFIVASCVHTYHISCIAYYVGFHTCYKVNECNKKFHQNSLLSIGIQPLNEDI
jgi:hypothetical protein